MAYKATIQKAASKSHFDNSEFQPSDGKVYGIKDAIKALSRFGGTFHVMHGKKEIGTFTVSHKKQDNTEVLERFKKWL